MVFGYGYFQRFLMSDDLENGDVVIQSDKVGTVVMDNATFVWTNVPTDQTLSVTNDQKLTGGFVLDNINLHIPKVIPYIFYILQIFTLTKGP